MIWRAVIRWLMHSRVRFWGVTLGVLVAVAVVVRLLGGASGPAEQPTAAPPSSSQATPTAPAPPPSSGPPSSSEAPPSTTAAASLPPRELAGRVAELWADTSSPAPEWVARLEPYTTPEYASTTLAQVDPANVPASRVTGPAQVLSDSGGTAVADVPLDALTLRVEMVDTGGGVWRVSGLAPEQTA